MRARWVAGAALAIAAAGVAGVTLERRGEALPGTTVAGVDVGGLDGPAVRAAVEDVAATRTSGALAVSAAGVPSTLPRDLLDVDVDATVDRALDDGGSVFGLLLRRGGEVGLTTSTDRRRLRDRLEALAAEVDRPAFAGDIRVTGLQVAALPPAPGRALQVLPAADAVQQVLEQGSSGPVELPVRTLQAPTTPAQVDAVAAAGRAALGRDHVLGQGALRLTVSRAELAPLLRLRQAAGGPVLALDTAGLRARVAARAAPLAASARNAGVSVAGPAAVVDTQGDLVWTPRPAQVSVRPATVGRRVDVDAATARLQARVLTADRTPPPPLPVTTVQPAITTAAAGGVRTLVGAFTTRFQAGQPRATNIRRIAAIVDGTWVLPGAEFSLNGTAGRRTRARGFVADGAIVDGELTDEVGGGVSQFATTLFNAAFFAGVPILEHKPHSFYISRYPAGRESTVYYGAIDVRFRNDTAHPLLVRTRSSAGSVTVELYGDNGGRRVVSTSGPRRPRADGGFRITVTRTTTGGDGQGGRRVFSTTYDPVPPED